MATRRRIDERRLTSAAQFAALLADTLHELRITHQQLARDLGITRYTVDSWTRAANPSLPSPENLAQLCLWLECRRPGLSHKISAAVEQMLPVRSGQPQGSSPWLPALLVATTSFVGREAAVAQLGELIARQRLITLVGAGGIGKTRLALRLAEQQLTSYADGVCVVELAGLSTAALVPQAVARALAIVERQGMPLIEAIISHLRGRELLLLLDSCEHVRETVSTLVEDLLAACPKLVIVATSRERLGLGLEQIWQVPPLGLPSPGETSRHMLGQAEATRLFLDQALRARCSLMVDERSTALIAHICRRLEGLPLAIELAAAWAGTLDLATIASRLDDRLRLLIDPSPSALARHRSLLAVIDWSYNLLTPPQRLLFARLGIFTATWEAEDAIVICADRPATGSERLTPALIPQLLSALAEKSLLNIECRAGQPPRYHMTENLRTYALKLLRTEGDLERLAERHAACMAELHGGRLPPALCQPGHLGQAWAALAEKEVGG